MLLDIAKGVARAADTIAMASKPQQHVLADHVCELVEALTKHRQGSGRHWLMVSEIEAALRAHASR